MNLLPEQATAHLEPAVWARVNRQLLAKAIGEFAHELLIRPQHHGVEGDWNVYRLVADTTAIEYRFCARRRLLDHWLVDPDSIEKRRHGELAEPDVQHFILEFRRSLAIDPELLPTYLEEISSTLYSSAFKQAGPAPTAEELTRADFQTVETAMTEGHPTFVANSGRIGFDASDYRIYAPEAGADVQLIWLAAHRSRAQFTAIDGVEQAVFLENELGAATLEGFHAQLQRQGLAPEAYVLIPVHPWQWYNKLAGLFAADIAAGKLICLGHGEDTYRAQQSIRTFFNTSRPQKHYVKTALSILNMGFMRGLSPEYMRTTPAINQWLQALIEGDEYLQATGFGILREVATVGYRNPLFEEAADKYSPYRKMLAALWRESPIPRLQSGQRLMTMASLLHVDRDGAALLPALIRSAGVDIDTWLRAYLKCYLSPLLHCFYRHDLVFMPHGENLILVLEGNLPVRVIMKDIAEEVAVMNTESRLPEDVQRLAVAVPEELKVLSIFTDLFDCIFRYLAAILAEHAGYPETAFWQRVAECIAEYQQTHPDLEAKFRHHDLFAPEFIRSCLNRLQLVNNQQMIDLADPAANLKFAGTLKNPIAAYRPQHRVAETEPG